MFVRRENINQLAAADFDAVCLVCLGRRRRHGHGLSDLPTTGARARAPKRYYSVSTHTDVMADGGHSSPTRSLYLNYKHTHKYMQNAREELERESSSLSIKTTTTTHFEGSFSAGCHSREFFFFLLLLPDFLFFHFIMREEIPRLALLCFFLLFFSSFFLFELGRAGGGGRPLSLSLSLFVVYFSSLIIIERRLGL